jgi:uncharacterized membrane protein YjdF
MTSVRIRTCVAGAAVAALAGALVTHGALFGADFTRTALLGIALGAVLGLVPHRNGFERLGGFAVGFLAAWLGYLVRAGMLPDIPMGRAIAAVFVISLITAVATATANRIPLWAGLLGAGALVGGYEAVYVATPTAVTSESTVAATSVLLAAAFGFAVTNILSALTPAPASQEISARHASGDPDALVLPADTAPVPGPRVVTDVPTTSESTR